MCVTQILSVLHNVWLNLDSNTQTDVLLLNFSKAFDSVDHNILLVTLNAYGISDNLLSWLTNYLSACFQPAVLEGTSSQWAPITSGAPQGSLLAPLMFVIFINDLPDASNGEVKILRFTLTIQRSLVLSSAFTTVKLCKPPFQIWMNGLDITSNLTPLNVKS